MKAVTYFLLLISIISFHFLAQPKTVFAGGACSSAGQCINKFRCLETDVTAGTMPTGGPCGGSEIIGEVTPPDVLADLENRGAQGINGLVFFISRLINFGTIIAGLITVGNFIAAGIMYISGASSGDTGMHTKVKDKITYGVIGLVIIVASYTVIGLIGLIFFGNPLFTLNPSLRGL